MKIGETSSGMNSLSPEVSPDRLENMRSNINVASADALLSQNNERHTSNLLI